MEKKAKESVIWYGGGGSGGHLFPLITLYRHRYHRERKMNMPHSRAVLFIHGDPAELPFLQERPWGNLPLTVISLKLSVTQKGVLRGIVLFFLMIPAFVRLFFRWCKDRPILVETTGGYGAIPLTLFSLLFRIRTSLYHLDVIPGKAAQLISLWTPSKIVFHETAPYIFTREHPEKISYPLRFTKKDKLTKEDARKLLHIPPNALCFFVMGGSKGSEEITRLFLAAIAPYHERNIYCFHQCPMTQETWVRTQYALKKIPATVFSFRALLAPYYAAADGIISRAGAGSIAEILFFKVPSVIIPLRNVANNHQEHNALCAEKNYPTLFFQTEHHEKKVQEFIKKYFDNEKMKTKTT